MPAFEQCRTVLEPCPDCSLCPRLSSLRASLKVAEPEWHNAPVPTFGNKDARLLVVGLAPGLRGANRTGRPFTGDFAGELLYATLIDFGFATGAYNASPGDGLQLVSCAITNAVRCVPPQNKPTPAETKTCRPFLKATIEMDAELKVIVALGRVAHDSVLRALGMTLSAFPFAHGAEHSVNTGKVLASQAEERIHITLIDSYHCSRYNTNTGVLTPKMFRMVFAKVRARLQHA